jgi:xanthine/CO dehydrogenase XdhC/CoxF family maturation factor
MNAVSLTPRGRRYTVLVPGARVRHWKETAEIFRRAEELAAAGRRAALATVVRIEGSAYRRPGARLLVEDDGTTLGSISGGCLESDVREVALAALREGTPRRRTYETGSDENEAWGLGLGCAGSVELFVQPVDAATLRAIARTRELFAAERPFILATVIGGGAPPAGLVVASSAGGAWGSTGDSALDAEIARRAPEWIAGRASRTAAVGPAEIFVQVLVSPPSLLLFGADDDAKPIAAFASSVGFCVTVVDHREGLLGAERFPGAERRLVRRPEDGVGRLGIGPHTFAVVKSHRIAYDREWARQLLAAGAGYVGLLGPRARTREIRRSIDAEDDPRVFGPVGLDLGAEGPDQVALSIVAELLAASSGVAPRPLREKEDRVHAS